MKQKSEVNYTLLQMVAHEKKSISHYKRGEFNHADIKKFLSENAVCQRFTVPYIPTSLKKMVVLKEKIV